MEQTIPYLDTAIAQLREKIWLSLLASSLMQLIVPCVYTCLLSAVLCFLASCLTRTLSMHQTSPYQSHPHHSLPQILVLLTVPILTSTGRCAVAPALQWKNSSKSSEMCWDGPLVRIRKSRQDYQQFSGSSHFQDYQCRTDRQCPFRQDGCIETGPAPAF